MPSYFYIIAEDPFRFLSAEEVKEEVQSRTYNGLLDSMRRAYGQDFSEDAAVTVLSYERIS